MVYLPECVTPLVETVSYLLKPGTGKSLFVNCLLRTEPYLGPIEAKCAELGLTVQYEPDVNEHATDKAKRFKVSLFSKN